MTVSITDTDALAETLTLDTTGLANGDRVTTTGVAYLPASADTVVRYVRIESATTATVYETYAQALAGGSAGRFAPSADVQTGSLLTFATNWVVLTATELKNVALLDLLDRADENTDATAVAGQAYDPALLTRRVFWAAQAVAAFRAAVKKGGRVALSATAGTVAPDALAHMVTWAAWRLLNAVPGRDDAGPVSAVLNDPAANDLRRLYDEAVRYLLVVADGGNVEEPTDPDDTGMSLGGAVRFGSVGLIEEADLTTQGPVTTTG